jgi:hypothetical protein
VANDDDTTRDWQLIWRDHIRVHDRLGRINEAAEDQNSTLRPSNTHPHASKKLAAHVGFERDLLWFFFPKKNILSLLFLRAS